MWIILCELAYHRCMEIGKTVDCVGIFIYSGVNEELSEQL